MAENKPAEEIVKKGERAAGNGKTTRLGGQPVASENISVTAGPQGPNLLDDIHLVEKLSLIHI